MHVKDLIKDISRGTTEIINIESLEKKLLASQKNKKPLSLKAGFDPTAPDMHLGHVVLLRKLRQFQDLGHHVFFLIGDFTAQVGDPTGRDHMRPQMDRHEIKKNAKTYEEQVYKILDRKKTKVVFNSSWLAKLTAQEMLELTAHSSVAQMLARADFKKRFEEDLQKLAGGLAKPKGRKKYPKVLERIGRLKEKHKHISGCYEINVKASEDRTTATAVDWKIIDEKMTAKLTGRYFLRTNLIGMGPKELWQLYNTLRGVEDAFRFMKSSLGLRPVYHQKEHRVDGHLWITVLAYHLIQNCLYQLGKQGITYNWETIRAIVGNRIRVTTQAKTQQGKTLYHRSTTKAEGEQVEIYKALGLSSQILKAQKTIL